MSEIPDTRWEYPVDLVLLEMGFTLVIAEGLIANLNVALAARVNISVDEHFIPNEAHQAPSFPILNHVTGRCGDQPKPA